MRRLNSLRVVKRFDILSLKGFKLYVINDEFFGVKLSDVCSLYSLTDSEIEYMEEFFSKNVPNDNIYGNGKTPYVKFVFLGSVLTVLDYYCEDNESRMKLIPSIHAIIKRLEKDIQSWLRDERGRNTNIGTRFPIPYVGRPRHDILDLYVAFASEWAFAAADREESLIVLRENNRVLREHNAKLTKHCQDLEKKIALVCAAQDRLQKSVDVMKNKFKDNLNCVRDIAAWKEEVTILKEHLKEVNSKNSDRRLDVRVYAKLASAYNVDLTAKRIELADSVNNITKITNNDVLLCDKELRDLYLQVLKTFQK